MKSGHIDLYGPPTRKQWITATDMRAWQKSGKIRAIPRGLVEEVGVQRKRKSQPPLGRRGMEERKPGELTKLGALQIAR